MTNKITYNKISNFMSLRNPQKEALNILADILANVSFSKNPDVKQILDTIKSIKSDKKLDIKDFERDFPTLCFSIATGVGKTRLMGAFIAYLYLEKNIKNFLIIAPNLTVYNKLINDFTMGNKKYVLSSIPEFTQSPPRIITGDDYSFVGGLENRLYEDRININIFNISKINRDEVAKGTPRIRARSEYQDGAGSYFDNLQAKEDLVIIMDEAHRYRASQGLKIINELNPILGLELTATAKTTGAKTKDFKNIVYHYPLAHAIHDGFVKKPAIITRSNFEKSRYSPEKMEEVKIKDGFIMHENIKNELILFAGDKNLKTVKPFMLIIARDTSHADELKTYIDNDTFKEGKYKGKVIVVHSNLSGVEKDENVSRLLEVEKADEPTEVVIHVNMLSEGWDVNNLYTIVPLKKADSKILVEQSIGRGLRLPYGEHTGNDIIDRLHIVAHDKFDDIVKAAEKEEFNFQKIDLDTDEEGEIVRVVNNPPSIKRILENAPVVSSVDDVLNPTTPIKEKDTTTSPEFVFKSEREKEVGIAAFEAIGELDKIINNPEELLSPEFQERVLAEVNNKTQSDLDFEEEKEEKQKIIEKVIKKYIEENIQIPHILMHKKNVGKREYIKFDLDLAPFTNLKPVYQQIILTEILSREIETKEDVVFQDLYNNLEDYIIEPMLNIGAIPHTIPETLSFFANQVLEHIKDYAKNEEELKQILYFNAIKIADDIAKQMQNNMTIPKSELVVKVSGNYTSLKESKIKGYETDGEVSFRDSPRVLSRIKNYVFAGFKKCLYDKKKFDSDSEREFSNILEDALEVIRWDKLSLDQAKEKIPLAYTKEDHTLGNYCVDFVVETKDRKYIVEIKAEKDISTKEVIEKRNIAVKWCEEATKYELENNGKPWTYLLIPHSELCASRTFAKLVNDYSQ